MVLILLHWKRRQSVVRKLNTVVSQLNAPGVYLTFGVVDPAFLTLLAEVFYLAPSFPSHFTAIFTIVVFLHREKTSAMIRLPSLSSMLCCYYRNN